VPVIADIRYKRMKGYSRKYTIGFIANTRNKHINIQCDYIRFFILGLFFILNICLTKNPSECLDISNNSQLYSARFCPYLLAVLYECKT
jgi:hypothetical protein